LLVRRRSGACPPAVRAAERTSNNAKALFCVRKNKKYFCDIAEAKEFGKLLWATGCAVGADRVRRLVFICDGAVWIWNLIAQYFPQAIQIVDWYHAADRLKRIAEQAFPNVEERHTWLHIVTEDLWQGRVEAVIEACRLLTNKSCWAKQSLTYYSHNIERNALCSISCDRLDHCSGIIESGCKQIVTQTSQTPWRTVEAGWRHLDRQSTHRLDEWQLV